MKISHENDTIYFSDPEIQKLGYTNYTSELWDIISNTTWTVKKDNSGNPKYIRSSQLNKMLHQVVIDFYFTEEVRISAYNKNFIVEHLDNDGFNCRISNLYFLHKQTNTYKGWHFDKRSRESIPIVSIRMFHIIENKRFQITAAFNYPFTSHTTGKEICRVKLLYDTSYEIVFQDAETLLDYILGNMKFDIPELRKILRYKDIRIEEYELIKQPEEYPTLQGGSCIEIDGKMAIVQGFDHNMRLISIAYDKDWI